LTERNHSSKKQVGLRKTTVQTPRTDAARLSQEEERVVRMLHGLSEPDDYQLTFAKTSDEEVNARLKLLEATLLADYHGKGPLAQAVSPMDKIDSHLAKLDKRGK
jgi:hypothetical protein